MNEITERSDITDFLARSDKSAKAIASAANILYKLSQNDPVDSICGKLTAAVSALHTEDIPDISGIKKYVYLAKVLERIDKTEERLIVFSTEIKGSLTELYKTNELLRTLSDRLTKESEALLSLETQISGYICSDTDLSENDKQLLTHQVKDINVSIILAEKNRQMISNTLTRNSRLLSGISSVENTLLPLWRAQLSQAKASCSADDIRRSFETGRLTAEKLFSFTVEPKK